MKTHIRLVESYEDGFGNSQCERIEVYEVPVSLGRKLQTLHNGMEDGTACCYALVEVTEQDGKTLAEFACEIFTDDETGEPVCLVGEYAWLDIEGCGVRRENIVLTVARGVTDSEKIYRTK